MAVDPARCARMALQMRHTIPPLGVANSLWLSQKTRALPGTQCLPNAPRSPREPGVPVVSREETRQACCGEGGAGVSGSDQHDPIYMGHPGGHRTYLMRV